MAIALALPALLLSAGIGYMNEKKRQATEQQQRSEGLIGQLITREAAAGNPELGAVFANPKLMQYIPKEAVPILQQLWQSNVSAQKNAQAGLRGESATPPIAELTGAGTQTAQAGGSGAGAGGVQMAPFAPPQPAQPGDAPVERTEYVSAPQSEAPVQRAPTPAASKTPSPVDDLLNRSYIEPTELNPKKAKSVSTPMYGGGTKTESAPDEDMLGRRVLAAGAAKNYKYTDIVEAATRKGYKVTDDFKSYGEAQFNSAFQNAMTGVNTSDVVATKDAARRAFQATGYLPDKFKELIVPTAEDEGALHHKTLITALGAGKSLPEALSLANATGLRPNLQQQNDAITKYSQNFRTQIEKFVPGLAPEQYDNLTRYATGGMGLSPEQAKGVVQPVPQSEEERAATFRKTGKVPRMGDLPGGQGQVTGPMLEGIHKTIQAEQVSQAGAKAGSEASARLGVEIADRPAKAAQVGAETKARTEAEAGVPRRPGPADQEKATHVSKAFEALQRMEALYSPSYVGPGKQTIGRITEKTGGMSSREAAFRSALQDYTNAAIFATLGKREPGQAAARVAGPRPQIGNAPNVFEARLGQDLDLLKKEAGQYKDVLESSGFKVPAIGEKDVQAAGVTAQQRFDYLVSHLPSSEQTRIGAMPDPKKDPAIKEIYDRIRREIKRGLVKP